MKPFLFLGIRAQDAAADDEYAAVLRCAGLDERDVRRVRLERDVLGAARPRRLVGDRRRRRAVERQRPARTSKAPEQRRGEARLRELALQVVAADFPFLGACYGIGTLGTLGGGVVDRHVRSEPIGAVHDHAHAEGAADPLLGVLPQTFDAFLGHKEAVLDAAPRRRAARVVADLPGAGVPARAATSTPPSSTPSSTSTGIVMRIEIYRHFGYFEPREGEELIRLARAAVVTEPPRILARFVELYARR